jgi:hypothetical protein
MSAFTWVGTPTYICKKCNCKLPLGIIENTLAFYPPDAVDARARARLPRPEAAMVAPLALGAATSAPLLLLLLLPLLQDLMQLCYLRGAAVTLGLEFRLHFRVGVLCQRGERIGGLGVLLDGLLDVSAFLGQSDGLLDQDNGVLEAEGHAVHPLPRCTLRWSAVSRVGR